MVFSSLPVNQFDSLNLQQQQANHHELDSNTTDQNPNNFQLPASLAVTGGFSHGTSQTNRVNSMVERARIAKIPLPESALKCPRCNSTNTKFCYFNNYSLTQPRHFCKTCRRYWTRGGALRNVPVGGGCRRNKRSKSNGVRSKSTLIVSQGENHQEQVSNNSNQISQLSSLPSYSSNPNKFLNYTQIPSFTSNSQISPLGDYNANNIGLDFGTIQLSNGVNGSSSTSGSILDPWRVSSLQQIQQIPFLINNSRFDQSSNVLYPLLEGVNQGDTQQESIDYSNQLIRSKPLMDMASGEDGTKSSNVKAEEYDQDRDRDQDGVNSVSRNFLGNMNINSSENNEYMTSWGGSNNISSSWTGFNSNNSTGHVSF